MRAYSHRIAQYHFKVQGYKPKKDMDVNEMITNVLMLAESMLQSYIMAGLRENDLQEVFLKIENEKTL